jgi:hypothetical protein
LNETVTDLAFSPDGATLAITGGTTVLWDVGAGQARASMRGGDSISFSPDGKVVAVRDSTGVQLVDVVWAQTIGPKLPAGSAGGVGSEPPLFVDGGRKLVITTMSGVVYEGGAVPVVRWDLDPESWVRSACAIANRSMTEDEWRLYMGDRPYRETCG